MVKKIPKTDPIVTKGAQVLSEPTKEVPKDLFGTAELKDIVRRMSATLRTKKHGVAIAANQIGIPYRIFVVRGFALEDKERSDEDPDRAFINPQIVNLSRKKEPMEEGCLSVPGWYGQVKRALKATVRAYDEEGIRYERGSSGLLAQIFQHEHDHLEGVLFVEKATELVEIPAEKDEDEELAPTSKK